VLQREIFLFVEISVFVLQPQCTMLRHPEPPKVRVEPMTPA